MAGEMRTCVSRPGDPPLELEPVPQREGREGGAPDPMHVLVLPTCDAHDSTLPLNGSRVNAFVSVRGAVRSRIRVAVAL